ncbi:MAG: helix-turn-helix transcriptional regulator, partial [Paracoccus sp. (in: a-proteobacteria)]|nr:helix-turn-helix transcriptional regulator [Paracoccus sp. (in: a-proteobacteria)]
MNETFRLRLRAEMVAQGLNPASLSKKADLNRRAVTDLLEGRAQSPKLSTAHSLAIALGVTIDEL